MNTAKSWAICLLIALAAMLTLFPACGLAQGVTCGADGCAPGVFNGSPACVTEEGHLHMCNANFSQAFLTFMKEDEGYDKGFITENQTLSITNLDMSDIEMGSLKGIEYFIHLTRLRCSSCELTSLDVGKNAALMELWCSDNALTELDISHNTALELLYSVGNALSSLDLSKNVALKELYCANNGLSELDISKNTELRLLFCIENALTYLDLSENIALTELSCSDNALTSLDVGKNASLTNLLCSGNALTRLDLSNNALLDTLHCDENSLTELDLSNNAALTYIRCVDNRIVKLDISRCANLTRLFCGNNGLTELDVSHCAGLEYLSCENNRLTSLDLSGNPKLEVYFSLGPQQYGPVLCRKVGNEYVADLRRLPGMTPEKAVNIENIYYYSEFDAQNMTVTLTGKEESFRYSYATGNEKKPYMTGITITLEYLEDMKALMLPDDINVIEADAFKDCVDLNLVFVPSGATQIGPGAFSSCTGLVEIHLPITVTQIADDAFSGCEMLIIYAPAGSEAEEYANLNGIPFEAE